jgi:predicted ATP-grasp superfamily ATP-dependent carboligase
MEALVTDTHDRAALAGLRALGRAGISTLAIAPERTAPGFWSRHAKGRKLAPDPIEDPEGFTRELSALLDRYPDALVYPGREEAIDALLTVDGLAERMPYGSLEGLAAVRDKQRLPALASSAGLEAPRTIFEGTVGELQSTRVDLPGVIKSANPSAGASAPRVVNSGGEVRNWARGLGEQSIVVIQELKPGSLEAVSVVLARDGSLAASFQQRTTETWPRMMGVSARAVSVEPDSELIEKVVAMLRVAGFDGLAQVQMLATGDSHVVIDVNPRFYGSLPLALAAGLNLPAIWHASALGATTHRSEYRVGVVFRWLQAELFARARGIDLTSPARAEISAGALWMRDDPVASAAAVVTSARTSARKRLRSSR